MQKSKLWAVLAVMMALAIVVSGCGQAPATSSAASSAASTSTSSAASSTASSAAETEKPLPAEITIFNANALTSTIPAPDTPVGQKIQELTGVKLNIEYLVGQDIMTKANLMVAGGVLPDVASMGEGAGIFYTAGALVDMNQYLDEYGENIKKVYRPKEIELSRAQYDGQFLVIPTNRPSVDNLYPDAGYYLAYEVLKDAGFPSPKTISEYKDIIVNYIEKNPTYDGQPTIGFTLPTEGSRSSAFEYGGARYLSGFPNDGVTQVDQETLEAKVVMTQPAAKEFVRFMNEMWNLGYMDKETFMQKNDQFLAKISSGRVVGVYDQRWGILDGLNALEKAGLPERNLVAFPVTVEGVEKEYYRGPYSIAVQGVGITTSAKDPEGAFRFLDMMCSDEIQRLAAWGIEGEDYTLENGKFTRTTEQWQKSFDRDYQGTQGFGFAFEFMPRREKTDSEEYAKFDDGNWVNPNINPEYVDQRYKDYEKQILKDYNITTLCDFFAPKYPAKYQPGWAIRQLLPQDSQEFISVNRALELANEWHAKIAQAPADQFEALWTEYQTLLTAIPGLAEYEAEATRRTQESAQYYG